MTKQRRILVLEERPPTLPKYKETWAIFTSLGFLFCLGIYYAQGFLLSMGASLDGIAALYTVAQPIWGPFFRFLKITAVSALTFFPLVIFTIIQIISFCFLVPAIQEKMQTLAALERALGPVTKPVHRVWFGFMILTALCTIALITLPSWTGESTTLTVFYSLLRIGLFATCVAATLGTALIGARLRYSWKKFRRSDLGLEPHTPTAAHDMRSHSTSAAPANYIEPEIKPAAIAQAADDESVFIALAAELVEKAGRSQQLPHYRQLEIPLLELQQAAAATHTKQFEHSNLRGLCEQACDLLAAGQLRTLPDLTAARTAYQKHDPSLYIDLATELRQKIKT